MSQQAHQFILQDLWQVYRRITPQIQCLETALNTSLPLDHFAVIDLPGPHTGIPQLKQIFSALDFEVRGQGYLADKQNEFWWMAEKNAQEKLAKDVLPQVVVADFRLDELPFEIKKIIKKYAAQSPRFSLLQKQNTIQQSAMNHYFSGRDWPLPTVAEFKAVQEFNELLAWVLVFGRKPNHFTVAVHLLSGFKNLYEFNQFLIDDLQFELNQRGGVIKGNAAVGIEQSSTVGVPTIMQLADGQVMLAGSFIEFVWRHPANNLLTQPLLWGDYFSGFFGEYANNIIESLYNEENIV